MTILMRIFNLASLPFLLVAGEYISFHQIERSGGLKSELEDPIFKSYNQIPLYIKFSLADDAKVLDESDPLGTWCGKKFNRYKIYIPAGLNHVNIYTASKPNSTYFALAQFIPDSGGVKEIDWTKVDPSISIYDREVFTGESPYLVEIHNVASIFDMWESDQERLNFKFESGWLYVQFIQASQISYSQFGHIDSPTINLTVEYFKGENNESFQRWFQNTKFKPDGDPVEPFDRIVERQRYCLDWGKEEYIYGDQGGSYLSPDSLAFANSSADSSNSQEEESTASSQPLSTTTSSEEHYCIAHGGEWVDGTCVTNSSLKVEQSSSSHPIEESTPDSSSYGKGGDSKGESSLQYSSEKLYCDRIGGEMIDGVCMTSSSSSSTSTSSSSSSKAPVMSSSGTTPLPPTSSEVQALSDGEKEESQHSEAVGSVSAKEEKERSLCDARGGEWIDGVCTFPSTSSPSSHSAQHNSASSLSQSQEGG
ncbi:MAG: hypothetical protein C6I05_06690, partial [Epsilonproteobacteria bacterium]|nr:hypothetical protein [Campylobacterota bacterium]